MQEYIEKLKNMTDDELVNEVEQKVWLSAYANNNPRSIYHKECDATSEECFSRRKPWLYSKGFNAAYESAGHTVRDYDRKTESPEHWAKWLEENKPE
jgi:hypothetical protein